MGDHVKLCINPVQHPCEAPDNPSLKMAHGHFQHFSLFLTPPSWLCVLLRLIFRRVLFSVRAPEVFFIVWFPASWISFYFWRLRFQFFLFLLGFGPLDLFPLSVWMQPNPST